MKKTFGLIRIDAVTFDDMQDAQGRLRNSFEKIQKEVNGNGSRVRLSWGNGNSSQEVERVVGQLKFWMMDQEKEKPRKSLWKKLEDELGRAVSGILDE